MKKTYKTELPRSYNDIFETKIVSRIEEGKLITDVEVYELKFGDIVRVDFHNTVNTKRDYAICIYPKKNNHLNIANINLEGEYSDCMVYQCVKLVKPATESEKQELFDKMREQGLRWNAEKKCVEKIEQPFEPKDGDFLFSEDAGVFVYNGKSEGKDIGAYLGLSCILDPSKKGTVINIKGSDYRWSCKNYCRYATEEEKEAFLEILVNEKGLVWDEKEKKTKRWRAKEDSVYFTIDIRCGKLIPCYDNEGWHNIDNKRYEQGNYFKTEEACHRAIEKIESVLKESSAV